jgi:endonuclease III related protein
MFLPRAKYQELVYMSHHKLLQIYDRLYAAFGPQHWWPARTPFEVAVGAILTQNTAWSNVALAIGNLRRNRCLTFRAMSKISEKKLALLIRPAGYFNIKAKRLKNFIRFLGASCKGDLGKLKRRDVHELRQELLGVNGIGWETADSILLYVLDKPIFVVDAYTKRVLSRHGYKTALKEDYDVVQHWFAKALPCESKLFNEYHALIVRLGKDYCKKTKPRCSLCPLKISGEKI